VVIGDEARLVECVVGDGARIPDGARYERCAIVPAATAGPGPGGRIDGALLIAPL
jgi:hypothetical protein